MEGTDSPPPFYLSACRACQDDGRLLFVPSSVPCVAAATHTCGLLQCWGCRVFVGSWVDGGGESVEGCVDVPIEGAGTCVENPFGRGATYRLCRAYDDLLLIILHEDLDFDRLATDYHRLRDEQLAGPTRANPTTRRTLLEIAARHDVLLAGDDLVARFTFLGVRAWIAYHVRMLRAGRTLRLLVSYDLAAGKPLLCHGASLAGALIRLAGCGENHVASVRASSTSHAPASRGHCGRLLASCC